MSLAIEVPISGFDRLRRAVSAVTVTASARPPTVSVWSRVMVSPRPSAMPSCV